MSGCSEKTGVSRGLRAGKCDQAASLSGGRVLERNQQGKGLVGSRSALRPGWVKGRLRGATRSSEGAQSQPVAATWA